MKHVRAVGLGFAPLFGGKRQEMKEATFRLRSACAVTVPAVVNDTEGDCKLESGF